MRPSLPITAAFCLALGLSTAGALADPPHHAEVPSEAELAALIRKDVASAGAMSVGRPSGGVLINSVRLPERTYWVLIEPALAWGTDETVAYLDRAVRQVAEAHPGSHPLAVGHLSARHGGHLHPHNSHQSGRDIDISYYHTTPLTQHRWFRTATPDNLDVVRTWALLRALVTETDVQYLFVDHALQGPLKEHARAIGEDADWLDGLFQVGHRGSEPAIVRHAPGHDTHIHIRFFNPRAQERARRAYPALVDQRLIRSRPRYVKHRAKKGDLLGRIAKQYGTTVEAIQRLNNLRGTGIKAGQEYLVAKKDGADAAVQRQPPVRVPPRRLPPATPRS